MKLALVYDRINKYGGAERVLEHLHQIWPDAPLYTSVYHKSSAKWANKFKIFPSFLQVFPFIRNHHEWFPFLMPSAFESFNFDQFDVVISVTSAEAKGIITKPHTLHISYILTPTRYLWSHTHQYQNSTIEKIIYPLFLSSLRQWDTIAAARPDKLVAISQTVKNRITKYYHRPVDRVIFPPGFAPHPSPRHLPPERGYYLIVSRLVPYKRIDIAIQAFNLLGLPLLIVGVGSQYDNLRKIAQTNVRMIGKLTQDKLVSYYHGCKAVVFTSEEDFGLVPIEAQSVGKPVIAFAKGGARETIINYKTGLFFHRQTANSLVKAVKKFETLKFNPKTCKNNARKFDPEQFKHSFKQYVEEQWHNHQHQK